MTRLGERGVAVLAVLMLILAATALAHATMVLARTQLGVALAGARHLQAQAAAEGALALTLAVPLGVWTDSLDHLEDTTIVTRIGGIPATGLIRRLSREAWLVEGVTGLGSVSPVRSTRLAWTLDPITRLGSLEAVVTVGFGASVDIDGRVDGDTPLGHRPPLDPDACAEWEPELSQVYGAGPRPRVVRVDTPPTLGPLGLDSLVARAGVRVAGLGTPAPVAYLGQCADDSPWNWGDPAEPNAPCASHLPLRGSAGDVVVEGGVGQGALVATGDVTFRNGARFYGVVVTGGELAVEGAAALEGLFIAGGGLRVASGSIVQGSACWALRALSEVREGLGGMVLTPGVGRIGPN